ncbi:MAG: reverse transcriptase family protein [Pirellulaceae bacterium]
MGSHSQLAGRLELCLPELEEMAASASRRYHVYPLIMGTKKRWIEAPDAKLKSIQRKLLDRVLYRIAPTRWAHGFVRGRSIVTGAQEHVGRRWVANLDIKDFFPSVTRGQVVQSVPPLCEDSSDIEMIANLVTHRGRLPQGAPTSPHLANLVVRRMDRRLAGLAEANGWSYTRYADDMSFSGDTAPAPIVKSATKIVLGSGFALARHKTQIRGQHQRQCVTGLTVNERVAIPRDRRRVLRAMLHNLKGNGEQSRAPVAALDEVAGYLSFLAMVCPEQYELARCQLLKIVAPGLGVAVG